jgi:DNA-binding LytR/AlgR family response regulator
MKGFLRDNGLSLLPSAESEERSPHIIYRGVFVLLTDDSKCRLTRIENISILEAFQNATLVHFAEDKLLIRRSLMECERRLDDSIFVRASRDCIVNLSQVRQPHLLKDGGLIFVLKDGREVVFLAGKEFSFGHYEERSSDEPVLICGNAVVSS